jgi:hypothetical protein
MYKILYLPTASLVENSNSMDNHVTAPTYEEAVELIQKHNFYEAWDDNIYIYRLDLAACHKLPKYLFEPIEVPDV